MPDSPSELLDRSWRLQVELDDHRPLWDSDIDQIERWPRTSVEHTTDARERLLAMRDDALALVADGGEDAPSLRTAADSALLVASQLDVEAELLYPHPTLGLHSYLHWAVNNFPLRTAEHGQRYLDKLAAFPAAVDELRGRLEVAAREGRAPIARHTRMTVERLDQHLASAISDDPLAEQAAPTDLAEVEADAWRQDLADAIVASVRPALGRLRETLHDVSLPAGRADEDCGLLHQPGGAATYELLVQANTTEGVTPDQVHATGLEQVERLAAEYRELGAATLGTADLGEIFRRLREDPTLSYTDADEVVAAATELHQRAQELAPAWFARTPRAACEIRAVEHGSIAFYSPQAADGSRPAVFFFNTSDPTVWGPNLAATVFHEGIPGHHFQSALALEDDTLHDLHRKQFLPAFGEGWGLYAERLADDIGLYADDIQRLGMLSTDSLRACRLVVDTGMHALGWSRQQAIDYMLDNSPMGVGEVTAEVDRYIGIPGQATSYMMGRLELQRLRDGARSRLGSAFELRDFHDVVLSRGMVSLPALGMMVDAWQGGPTR